jgi:Kef-type K+ transport system membrane component KefB
VFGLGSSQVLGSALIIGVIAFMVSLDAQTAIVVGLILALSSTSFVLQILAEKNQLSTTYDRVALAILLFQDLAVIPLIAILPVLGPSTESGAPLVDIAIDIATIIALVVGGRFCCVQYCGLLPAPQFPKYLPPSHYSLSH